MLGLERSHVVECLSGEASRVGRAGFEFRLWRSTYGR